MLAMSMKMERMNIVNTSLAIQFRYSNITESIEGETAMSRGISFYVSIWLDQGRSEWLSAVVFS